ncbi:hypothetical protein [Ectopseudomonas guguanensis]|uniref:hypothetical protein n=1 Tax=Ectopseudomonas guguanensis TaxID=1198456 RepID=UPI00285F82B2|nr:hypothetical protein [Pseudomonas guguanensis]MDR8014073.1 hypothetical protein [Pseudomonas guguanensis]
MQVKPQEVSGAKATTPGQIDRPIATCSRGLFETWVLETEHPVIGWVGADWLDQGDAPNTYANDYIQGAWVMWQWAESKRMPVIMPNRANVPARVEGPSGETANLTSIKAAEAYNRALDDVARLNGSGKESELANALGLAIRSLDQLVPYLAKVPADVGLLNQALMAGRKALQGGAV